MNCEVSKAWRSSRPHLAVCLEALYHHLPLSLVLEEVTEELLLFTVILADPLQASLRYSTKRRQWRAYPNAASAGKGFEK